MTQTELAQKHQLLKRNKEVLLRNVIYLIVGNLVGIWLVGGLTAFAMAKTWVLALFILGLCLQLFFAYRLYINYYSNKKYQMVMLLCAIVATIFLLMLYLRMGD